MKNHQVVGKGHEPEFAALTAISSPVHGRAEVAFDHGEDGLALPALAVTTVAFAQALFHAAAVSSRRQFGGGPAQGGRHERSHVAAFAGVTVVGFRIVASVGHDAPGSDDRQRGLQQRHEAIDIDVGSAAGQHADDDVTGTIAGNFEFGKAAVSDGLPGASFAGASSDEVATGVTAIQAGGVEGDAGAAAPPTEEAAHSAVQQAAGAWLAEQTGRGLLQSGKVGNALQADSPGQIRGVGQVLGDAAVIGVQKGLQHQASEQLGLGIEFWTVAMGIGPQGLATDSQGRACDSQRRLTADAHSSFYARS
jgi:hypothetical protein